LAAPSRKIVGAENLNRQFVDWLVQLGHTAYADLPDVPNLLVVSRDGDEGGMIAAPMSDGPAAVPRAFAEAGQ
jgi:hypothetical protein